MIFLAVVSCLTSYDFELSMDNWDTGLDGLRMAIRSYLFCGLLVLFLDIQW